MRENLLDKTQGWSLSSGSTFQGYYRSVVNFLYDLLLVEG